MSISKLAGIVAGVLLSAGAANAQSVFPSSANETSPTGLAQNVSGNAYIGMGAAQPVFPTSAIEHGPVRDVAVTARSGGVRPSRASNTSAFPTSARENGPSL